MAISLFILGFGLLIMPTLLATKDGVNDDADLIDWIMQRPLQFLFSLQTIQFIGINMMIFALALGVMPQ